MEDELEAIRANATDSADKWNVILAQADRIKLLEFVGELQEKVTTLENENAQLRAGRDPIPAG